jgi:alpha-glucosidase
VRDWYAKENNHYLKAGVDFWWNDEGEVTYFMFDEWTEALASGWSQINPSRRSFSLNRAFTPGTQKYGTAIWTGDVAVSWRSLQDQPAMMLNTALMGMPYIACDTGGFAGGEGGAELLTRWYQMSALMSIMRVHSNDQVVPHFPFLFGQEAADAMRKALDLRYQLIPFLYSLGHHAFTDGLPIIRPLFMEFPSDAKAWEITDQWLLGSGLMAAPILTPSSESIPSGSTTTRRTVYFPEGVWYVFNSTTAYTAGAEGLSIEIEVPFDGIPLFVRAGTILPLAPAGIQHTGQLGGFLNIHVYTGADASFTMVEDDGDSTRYETDPLAVRQTKFIWDEQAQKFLWTVVGSFMDDSVFTTHQVRVIHPNGISPSDHSRWSTAEVAVLGAVLVFAGMIFGFVAPCCCIAKKRQASPSLLELEEDAQQLANRGV